MEIVIRYSLWDADDIGENRHPQIVFREFAEKNNLEILESTPHPIGDCWIFKVKSKAGNNLKLTPQLNII